LIAGGNDGSPEWKQVASRVFKSAIASSEDALPKATFALDPSTGNYTGVATGSKRTSLLGLFNVSAVSMSVNSTAVKIDNEVAVTVNPSQNRVRDAWIVAKSFGFVLLTGSAGEQIAIREGMVLGRGNRISTAKNGRLVLVRGRETIIVYPDSVMGIPLDTTQGMLTTVHQWAGSIVCAVEKHSDKHFDVITPYLSATVKGTRFRVTVQPNGAKVDVLSGQVEVANFKSGEHALVKPEQTARVMKDEASGLTLTGSGVLSPILRGPASQSPLTLSEWNSDQPSGNSGEKASHRQTQGNIDLSSGLPDKNSNDISPKSGLRTILGLFARTNPKEKEEENVAVAILFVSLIGLGVTIFVAAWRRRRSLTR